MYDGIVSLGGGRYDLGTIQSLVFTATGGGQTISKSLGAGIAITNASQGEVTLTISSSDTSGWTVKTVLVCRVTLTDSTGTPYIVGAGTLRVRP